jgi:hypothetical protein
MQRLPSATIATIIVMHAIDNVLDGRLAKQ